MPSTSIITPRPVKKNGRKMYLVRTPSALIDGCKESRRFFRDKESAMLHAAALMRSRSTPDTFWQRLTPQDQEKIRGLVSRVDGNVAELIRLFDIGLRHGRAEPKPLGAAVNEFLDVKERDGVSDHMLRNYRATLRAFAGIGGTTDGLTSPQVDDWLRGLGVEPVTRNKKRGQVRTFLAWCQGRGYISHETRFTLSLAIEPARDVEILTPDELRELLKAAAGPKRKGARRSSLLAYLCIGAFAGLRSAEIARLDWSDIDLAAKHIRVRATISKNKTGRIVPILPNLEQWLTPIIQPNGRVCGGNARMGEAVLRLASQAKIEWKRNALRHSFTSYRVAVTQSEAQVATEIGDLVTTMKAHYKAAVPKKAGIEWFSIA